MFVSKSIKIKSSVFNLQSKTSGTFFIGTQCTIRNVHYAVQSWKTGMMCCCWWR